MSQDVLHIGGRIRQLEQLTAEEANHLEQLVEAKLEVWKRAVEAEKSTKAKG